MDVLTRSDAVAPARPGRWITHWDPEDEHFWATGGRRVAHRNLIFSIFAEHVGFSVWLLWSVIVVSLPAAGFDFSVSQLFWLVALPNLVGGVLRFPYTFAVPRFGGRNWTVVSALLLLIPLGLLIYSVSNPGTSYGMFLLAAAACGWPTPRTCGSRWCCSRRCSPGGTWTTWPLPGRTSGTSWWWPGRRTPGSCQCSTSAPSGRSSGTRRPSRC